MSLAISPSTSSEESPTVSFDDKNGRLTTTITTKRLIIRSIQKEDLEDYRKLYGDPEVMAKYQTGEPKTSEWVASRVNTWIERWLNKDPYSALAVFQKDTKKFIGSVVPGHGDKPGESELAYLFHKTFWGKGYGKEAVAAVIKTYTSKAVREKYKLEEEPLHTIIATSRLDNPASCKILESLGMNIRTVEKKYGAWRNQYVLSLDQEKSADVLTQQAS